MKRICISMFLALLVSTAGAQGYQNPVLPGFYPDPSVCRVGDDYYLVNSSFQFFPAIPIHHSKDLIHWEPIGHCLTRTSQVKLEKIGFWHGIYAPTICYHNGVFYVVVTNTSDKGNFYVYTDNPAGEWSDPVWVNQGGIDPDLFFDDDGKVYFLSANVNIQIAEIDLMTGKLLTESRTIYRGTGARYVEGPHMYKKDGWYYLLTAEGGTEYGHKVAIARSRSLDEAFVANPANPILTHINENAANNPIQGVGHADLVQAHDESWWAVCLAFRPLVGFHHLLGRETYLAPVRWDKNAWPVVNGDGTIALDMADCPTLPQVEYQSQPVRDEFDNTELGYEWSFLCNPHTENYSLTERKGSLRLKASEVTLDVEDSPTFVGRRQQHIDFRAGTLIDFGSLSDGGEAGMTVYMGGSFHYDWAVACRDGKRFLTLSYRLGRMLHKAMELELKGHTVLLRIEGNADCYTFYYSMDGKTYQKAGDMDTRFLSTETAGGFTGIMLGLYAQSENKRKSVADFDWFEYTSLNN